MSDKQINLFEFETEWEKEWKDMPEFVQDSKDAIVSVLVSFENIQDMKEFAKITGLTITKKTTGVFFPPNKRPAGICVDEEARETNTVEVEIEFVDSKTTGGHYAFRNTEKDRPFESNLKACKSIELNDGDVVADIGAYVGEYSLWAIKNGVKEVRAYEPTPRTFTVLEMNKKENMKIYNQAVIGTDDEYVNLHISRGMGVTNSVVKSYRKIDVKKVSAVQYEQVVKDVTVVKIDVEGAEYFYNIVQPGLRAIILEFHSVKDFPWREQAKKIIQDIENAGFFPVLEPDFDSGWSYSGSWKR